MITDISAPWVYGFKISLKNEPELYGGAFTPATRKQRENTAIL
jgi:hypothetical protein